MSFASYIIDEEEGEKKRKEIENVIKKAVKGKLIDVVETEGASIINFKSDEATIKETIYKVAVSLNYRKQIYRGIERCIFIHISKESNSYKTTDNIQLDIHSMSAEQYVKAVDSIKNHFQKLAK